MSNVEEILIRLGLDNTALGRDLRTTTQRMGDWANNLKSKIQQSDIGGPIYAALTNPIVAAGGVLVAFAAKIKSTFDEIREQAKDIKFGASLTGMDADEFQPIMLAGKATGVDSETIAKGILKVAEAMDKVKHSKPGAAEALASFSELGVKLTDINTKSAKDIFKQIGGSMHVDKITDEQLVAGAGVMGKGFESMIPMFKRGFNNPLDQMNSLDGETMDTANRMAQQKKIRDALWDATKRQVVDAAIKTGNGDRGLLSWLAFHLPGAGAVGDKTVKPFIAKDPISDALSVDAQSKKSQPSLNEREIAEAKRQSARLQRQLMEQEQRVKEHPEAERLNKEAAANEEKLKLKILPLEEEIHSLESKKLDLKKIYNDECKTELERATARNELSKVDLSIEEKKKKLKEDNSKLEDLRRKRGEHVSEPYMSTLAELSTAGEWRRNHWGSGRWRFQESPFARTAQEIQDLEFDAKHSRQMGRFDRAKDDEHRIERLKDLIPDSVMKKDEALLSIDRNIAELMETAKGKKNGGIVTQPPANFKT